MSRCRGWIPPGVPPLSRAVRLWDASPFAPRRRRAYCRRLAADADLAFGGLVEGSSFRADECLDRLVTVRSSCECRLGKFSQASSLSAWCVATLMQWWLRNENPFWTLLWWPKGRPPAVATWSPEACSCLIRLGPGSAEQVPVMPSRWSVVASRNSKKTKLPIILLPKAAAITNQDVVERCQRFLAADRHILVRLWTLERDVILLLLLFLRLCFLLSQWS